MSVPSGLGDRSQRLVATVLVLSIGLILVTTMINLPEPAIGLGARVDERLPDTGVRHPVTAVLLNFRGYDTLLEIAVLLVAVLGVLAIAANAPAMAPRFRGLSGSVLHASLRFMVPIMVLAAGYLLWAGDHQAGGAFQGGAVLGGAGALLFFTGLLPSLARPGGWLRAGLLLGFGLFLGSAAVTALGGARLLEYPRSAAGSWILLIEAGLTLSIALILITLLAGASAAPVQRRPSSPQGSVGSQPDR